LGNIDGATAGTSGGTGSGTGSGDGSGEDPKKPRQPSNKDDTGIDVGSESDEEESADAEDQVDEEELPSSNPGSPGHHQVQAGQDPAVADADQGQARYIEGKDSWLSYKELMATTYPAKSRKIYLASYVQFENYLKKKGADPNVEPDELSILNYFHHLRTDKKWASTTLWSHFSRVNAVMKRTWGFSMTKYPRVPDLLKGYEGGHRVKKACVFSPQQAS
jgi:hypothetical protein